MILSSFGLRPTNMSKMKSFPAWMSCWGPGRRKESGKAAHFQWRSQFISSGSCFDHFETSCSVCVVSNSTFSIVQGKKSLLLLHQFILCSNVSSYHHTQGSSPPNVNTWFFPPVDPSCWGTRWLRSLWTICKLWLSWTRPCFLPCDSFKSKKNKQHIKEQKY